MSAAIAMSIKNRRANSVRRAAAKRGIIEERNVARCSMTRL